MAVMDVVSSEFGFLNMHDHRPKLYDYHIPFMLCHVRKMDRAARHIMILLPPPAMRIEAALNECIIYMADKKGARNRIVGPVRSDLTFCQWEAREQNGVRS